MTSVGQLDHQETPEMIRALIAPRCARPETIATLMAIAGALAISSWGPSAHAADDDATTPAPRAQLETELRDARERLDDAARDVAELTRKLYGDEEHDVMQFIGQPSRGAMLGVNIDSDGKEGEGVKVGALKSITDPTGRAQTFEYDDDKLKYIRDFADRTTTLNYDDGVLSEVIKPDGTSQLFGYDAATGLLTSRTDELGQTTYFEYDNLNRISRTILPDGSSSILQSPDTTSAARRVLITHSGQYPVYLGSSIPLAAP